jgi:hypothetical protein
MGTPNHTIELLESLKKRGFDDLAFSHLHHRRAVGRSDSIAAHIKHCAKTTEFESGGNNERVQKRLELVLGAYASGGFTSGRQEVFVALAEAAWHEVPHPAGANVEDGG